MSVDDEVRRTVVGAESGSTDSDVGMDGCCGDSSSEDDDEYGNASTRKASELPPSMAVMQAGGGASNIHMENSSDVQIGPRLHYNAPVTINQYVSVQGGGDDGDVSKRAAKAPLQGLDAAATIVGHDGKLPTLNGAHPLQQGRDRNKLAAFVCKRRLLLAVVGIAFVVLVVVVTVLIMHFSDPPSRVGVSFNPPPQDPEPDPNNTLASNRSIYSKADWYGADPRYVRQLRHPTPFVVISHTATPACFKAVECAAQMRSMQDFHMGDELDLPDIGYSFAVGGDGDVYEGRGWDATNMHTGFVRRCNIGITFIGNFVHDTPTNEQLQSVQELIDLGVRLGKLDEHYKLVPMNETYGTMSPGPVLYAILKTWPHFWKPSHDDIGKCPYSV